ncbi:hypothetical protein V7S43_011045 [Phytophthora oleae]|uniref:Uncharacterized protein n=1 Tax=Phytophthora oleae TaxID=2107226 RepID=A0ABD3FF73_9STRA
MEPNQSTTGAQASSIQLVKSKDSATLAKEKKERERKPQKKRFIFKQSMAFMHC